MYETGALVLYHKRGVYRVEGVGEAPVRGLGGAYYKLSALFSDSGETIYTPVDGAAPMRPLISQGEAARCLELFAALEAGPPRFGKPAELTAHCQSMLASRRVEDCLVLIRELQARQEELARQKKHLGQADSQYLKLGNR